MGEVSEGERKEFAAWAWAAQNRTTFDLDIIGHPRAVMFIAEKESPRAYLPVQSVLMAEVFIPQPGANLRTKVEALQSFDKALMSAAERIEIQDVYCFVPDAEIEYSRQLTRYGWKEIEQVRLFKKTIPADRT